MNENEIISSFRDSFFHVLTRSTIEQGTLYFYEQKYYLNRTDGNYERSVLLLIHHVLFYEEIYHKFLSEEDISEIEEIIDEPLIYRNDNHMDLLDELHSEGKTILKVLSKTN